MINKVINLLKDKPLIIPSILMNKYRSLNITDKEFVVLIYLINYNGSFNPKLISKEINFDLKEFMEVIGSLTDKGLIKIEIVNNKIKDEIINLEPLYQKIGFIIINDEKENTSDVYSVIEKEFGRTLSPMEYEIIKVWLQDFEEKLILLAVREATFNGVSNLRYIDKILHEWQKKGIKNEQTLALERKNHTIKKQTKKIMDYDWLNE